MIYRPRQEEGQGLVEYALILIMVAVIAIVVVGLVGPTIGNLYQNIMDELGTAF